MDVTSSPVNKQAQSRAARTSSSQKSNKETSLQKEGSKPVPRSKENPATARNEPNVGSQGSSAPCKTFPDKPGERKRGRSSRSTRLSGRASSGERGKGQARSFQVAPKTSRRPLGSQDRSLMVGSCLAPNLSKIDGKALLGGYPCMGHTGGPHKILRSWGENSGEDAAQRRPAVEEGDLTEQQLGLRQAEERLLRDYIHRLVKVRSS
uniref:Uncharacterized protein n=1 Tax=Oryzias melastigma TaxID=30732 RepID=A0A3B3C8Y1_ORYME